MDIVKTTMRFLLIIILLGSTVTCGWGAVLKIASVAPEGSFWMQEMRKGAAEIKERSGGRVIVKFYGGGVMGNEKSVLRKIRVGQLQGGVFTSGGLAEVYQDIQLYSQVLKFNGLAEVDYVRQRMDPDLIQGLLEAGFVSFGFAEGGFAQLMGNVPVRSLADLKGRKFWVPEGDAVSYAVIESLGLSPVTLPLTDVMTGLQTGLVEILGSSPIAAIAFQWHTKLKYVNPIPIAYLFATMVIDRKSFERLTPEDQILVRSVMEASYAHIDRQNRLDNQAAAAALLQQGLVLVDPPPGEQERWQQLANVVNTRMGQDGTFSPALYQKLDKLLATFRAAAPPAEPRKHQ